MAEKKQTTQRFHHKHLPNYTRWTKQSSMKFSHLFFPIIIHFLTDKYHGRIHHLIVDMIYGVVAFILAAANIGLAIWFYLYFTPAEVDVRVFTQTVVTSGEEMTIGVQYLSPHRPVEDMTVDVYLPSGFILDAEKTEETKTSNEEPVHFSIGSVERFEHGTVDVVGEVLGSVGETYDVRIITSYRYMGRIQYETTIHRFSVTESLFDVTIDFPKTVGYDTVVDGVIRYENNSDIDSNDVQLHFTLPPSFRILSVSLADQQLFYNQEQQTVLLPNVAAHETGELFVTAQFDTPQDAGVIGDQQQVVSVEASSQVIATRETERFVHGKQHTSIDVITPRATLSLTGDDVVDLGETIHTTVSVTNIGERPLERVELFARAEGVATQPTRMNATNEDGAQTVANEDGVLALPVIDHLDAEQTKTFTVSLPTFIVSGEKITSTLTVDGTAFSPDIDTTVTIAAQRFETKYNSRVSLDADSMYFTPEGEQLGYGPYPPHAWEPTALRVVMRVSNQNNPLSDVRIKTTLPSQVEWTNFYSVTAGTSLTYDVPTRTIEWYIPTLHPQQLPYGAQFEVRLTPNHLQIGQKPHVIEQSVITARDAFTLSSVYQTAPPLAVPVAVVE